MIARRQVGPPRILTLSAAVVAVEALRNLHSVCSGMDCERQDDRPSEDEYQAAMHAAEAALRACPHGQLPELTP